MRQAGLFLLLLLTGMPILLSAQGNDDPEWDYYDDVYARGDQTFAMSLGVIFPTIFRNNGETIEHKFTPPVGGTGSLAYNYYFTKELFAGLEVGGMFISTLGEHTLFIIPVGIRGGYQFNIGKFEFPLTAVAGVAFQRFLNDGHVGLYLKGGISAFYRVTVSWSFGINSNWYWFPQWTGEKEKNVYGNMLDLTLSARYHF
jgi:hypothetical protein